MIVVDTTVLADFLIGQKSEMDAAKRLADQDPDWISVGLWRYELGNVLWKAFRFQDGNVDRLRTAMTIGKQILVETVDDIDSGTVLEIACADELSFYDASFVWLARVRGFPLRTRDHAILKKCPDVALPMPV